MVYMIKVGNKVIFKSAIRENAIRFYERCNNAKFLTVPANNASR